MNKDINTQIGRIKSILKYPLIPSNKILPRVLKNLIELKKELPTYKARVRFTNQSNISTGVIVDDLGVPEWFGLIACRVGDLLEIKVIWKLVLNVVDLETQRGLLIVGDKHDITLALHLLEYLDISINLNYEHARNIAKQKNKELRILRRHGEVLYKITDAREIASSTRSNTVKCICVILDELLESKGDSLKEAEIYKYILHNLKLDFSNKPGPKTPPHYKDIINWDKARTLPSEFKNNKLIN